MGTTNMVAELLPRRLATKIIADNGTCWLWTGATNSRGYGSIGVQHGKTALVHRYVYELLVGTIPDGLTIDHLCMVKTCVNPEHMEPVTRAENSARGALAITHCRAGHALAGDNLVVKVRRDGEQRVCRECRAKHSRDYRARQKAVAA